MKKIQVSNILIVNQEDLCLNNSVQIRILTSHIFFSIGFKSSIFTIELFSEKSIHYPFIRYNVLCVEPLLIFLSKIFHNCFRNIFLKIETKSQLYGWINRGASMDEHETLIKLNWIIYSLHVHGLNYFCCSCLYYILCIPQILFLKKNFSIIFITVLNKNFK